MVAYEKQIRVELILHEGIDSTLYEAQRMDFTHQKEWTQIYVKSLFPPF